MADKQAEAYIKLRITPERRDWLKERAKLNNRSMNAEFNFILNRFHEMEQQGYVPKVA